MFLRDGCRFHHGLQSAKNPSRRGHVVKLFDCWLVSQGFGRGWKGESGNALRWRTEKGKCRASEPTSKRCPSTILSLSFELPRARGGRGAGTSSAHSLPPTRRHDATRLVPPIMVGRALVSFASLYLQSREHLCLLSNPSRMDNRFLQPYHLGLPGRLTLSKIPKRRLIFTMLDSRIPLPR